MRKYKYKVIKKISRKSAFINGNSKYAIDYIKNENVCAPLGSLGVLVFNTKKAAKYFRNNWKDKKDLIVIKVIPTGRGKRIHYVSPARNSKGLDNFYKNNSLLQPAPGDTMGYPGVFVVD